MKTVAMVKSERHTGDSVSLERRYYLSSLECEAENVASAVRGHRGIENSLHWVLDVSFGEDPNRIKKGNGAENMTVVEAYRSEYAEKRKNSQKEH